MAKITALMTTYNSAAHVSETIESILNQSYTDFEFLIIDDGSEDNTVSVIKSYKDSRIRLIECSDNQGVGARLSQALNEVKTPYIAKVDSDDISHPERFEKQLNYLEQNSHLDIVKCYFEYFPDNDGVKESDRYKQFKETKEKEHNDIDTPELIKEGLQRWCCVAHTTYFAKANIIKLVGYPKFRVGEDYSLFYNTIRKGYKIGCIPENLVGFRVSNFSTTTKENSSDNYAQALIEIKSDVVKRIKKINDGFWIYGTGGLGRGVCKVMIKKGYKIHGFLDCKKQKFIKIENETFAVESIYDVDVTGILIAAQPVRKKISKLLKDKGLTEWNDYIVVA